jgi:acyl carrier protein
VRRKDDEGKEWTADEVTAEVIAIVRDLSPGVGSAATTAKTTFAKLGWDSWYRLRLLKPVRKRLHERLPAQIVMDKVRSVGDLRDLVWALMEDA